MERLFLGSFILLRCCFAFLFLGVLNFRGFDFGGALNSERFLNPGSWDIRECVWDSGGVLIFGGVLNSGGFSDSGS